MTTEEEEALPARRKASLPHAVLDEHALTVVRRLQHFGHEAYLVGGCVRDLLVGLEPKDFDVVTDARPNRIKRLFRNARVIGRRFRLAHIRFGPDHVIETSTFRGEPPEDGRFEDSENVFGTAPEDARRRDFTINALFYDPLTDEVIDWTGGLGDLEEGVVRAIGNPPRRIREDPVRMIRAVHFAARMDFRLEPGLEAAIRDQARDLQAASPARLYVELIKVLRRARARPTLHRLHEFGVLHHWLPELAGHLDEPARWPEAGGGTHEEASHGEPEDIPVPHATWNLLGAADRWGQAAHGADEALCLAPLLGPWIVEAWRRDGGGSSYMAFQDLFDETLRPLARRMSVPRRTQMRLRDLLWIWLELRRYPSGKRAARTAHRPAFREALAFLRLDLMARDQSMELFDAWEDFSPPRPTPSTRREKSRRARPRRHGGRGRGRGRGRGDPGHPSARAPREEADAWAPAPEPPPQKKPPPANDSFAEGLLDD